MRTLRRLPREGGGKRGAAAQDGWFRRRRVHPWRGRVVDGHIGRAVIRGGGRVDVGRGLPRHVGTPEGAGKRGRERVGVKPDLRLEWDYVIESFLEII